MHDLLKRLRLEHPIILAPMAGEASCAALPAAVSEAGGLGSVGVAYLAPARITALAAELRTLTSRPFALNLFCPLPHSVDAARVEAFNARLAGWFAELGLPPPALPGRVEEDFDAQFAAVLEARPAVVSFTFGDPGAGRIRALQDAGAQVWGTATHAAEALRLQASGVDAVIAQGAEAGGHRGSFIGPRDAGLIGTIALVPQLVDALAEAAQSQGRAPVPVIAAGGIADARGVRAVQALGAAAAAVGTAFLVADECPLSAPYREALLGADGADTVLTAAFSGRWARGLGNEFTRAFEGAAERGELPDFPLPNALTRPMRQAAAKAGRAGLLSLWAGQAVGLARARPAAEILRELATGWDRTAG
ncbi:NAD(P)H-dependent flavin oxidoreductase [Caldimonas tepidiphila]|uniref:NAD(P)H-dependent flavin oxidoreductase n=1 Tax=Caldimonas tepidiphila TaxID=2315841 RepID=UPI000E5A7F73|nr:nitronate monooxygenase [Caldimonas tepidiphila]